MPALSDKRRIRRPSTFAINVKFPFYRELPIECEQMRHVRAFPRRQNASRRVQPRHGAAVAAEGELAEDDVGGDGEAVVNELVDDEPDHLIHVNLLGFDFDRNVRLVAAERAVVSDAHGLPRAVVARNGTLQLGVIVLRQHDDRLFEGGALLRRHADDALLDGVIVGNEGAEILAPANGDHARRRSFQLFNQRLQAEELGLAQHVNHRLLRRQGVAAQVGQDVAEVLPVAVDEITAFAVLAERMPTREHDGQHGLFVFD